MGYAEAQYTADEVIAALKSSGSVDSGGTSGIPPLPPSVAIIPGNNKITLKIGVRDTIVDNQKICAVKGVMIRIKSNESLNGPQDGELYGNYEGSYTFDVPISNLSNGSKYGIGVWSYSDHGVFNLDSPYLELVTIGGDIIFGFHQDFTDKNPDTCITYIGANQQYTPMYTRVKETYVNASTASGGPYIKYYASTPGTKDFTLGSWENWSWLKKVKPFVVESTETYGFGNLVIKHRLDPNNLNIDADTGKQVNYFDSTEFPSSRAGVFAWIPKIYVKEVYDSDGNGRTVYFSETKNFSETAGFSRRCFVDKNGNEVEGLWLGTNYSYKSVFPLPVKVETGPTNPHQDLIGGPVYVTPSAMNDKNNGGIINQSGTKSNRGFYFGGAFAILIRDILYMLYKTTDIQKASGYGSSDTPISCVGYVASSSTGNTSLRIRTKYSNSEGITIPNGSGYLKGVFAQIQNPQGPNHYNDVWAFHGGFYGEDSVYRGDYYTPVGGDKKAVISYGFGKLFYSIALGSYLAGLFDPEFRYVNNGVQVSTNHIYDTTVSTYTATTLTVPSSGKVGFTSHMVFGGNDIGSIPLKDAGAGATNGLTDYVDLSKSTLGADYTESHVVPSSADLVRFCYWGYGFPLKGSVGTYGAEGPTSLSERFFCLPIQTSSGTVLNAYDPLEYTRRDYAYTGRLYSAILMLLPDPNTTPYDSYGYNVWDE